MELIKWQKYLRLGENQLHLLLRAMPCARQSGGRVSQLLLSTCAAGVQTAGISRKIHFREAGLVGQWIKPWSATPTKMLPVASGPILVWSRALSLEKQQMTQEFYPGDLHFRHIWNPRFLISFGRETAVVDIFK